MYGKSRMWLFASTPLVRLCRSHRIWILGSLGSSLPIQGELLVCSLGATALLCSSLKALDQSLRYKTTRLLDLGNKKARLWLKGLLPPLPEVTWAMVHQGSWLLWRDLFAMCLDHTGETLLAGTAFARVLPLLWPLSRQVQPTRSRDRQMNSSHGPLGYKLNTNEQHRILNISNTIFFNFKYKYMSHTTCIYFQSK